MKNADNLLFRAHSFGKCMTGVAKGWDVDHSLTCQQKLIDIHREEQWSRRADTGNKYTKKGLHVEQDGMTLLSIVKEKYFVQNEEYLYNEYFKGKLDTFIGESLKKAEATFDIKCSWDWTTFPSFVDKVESDYDYQGQIYMDLSGAKTHTIAYCLVNTPGFLIVKEKRNLAYTLGISDELDEEYISQCIEIEKNAIVDMELFKKHNPEFQFHCKSWEFDIPAKQRVYEMVIKRDEAKIAKMKERVLDCRKWMNNNLF